MSENKKDRNEYMKEYMKKYRKEKPEKNVEAVKRYWKKRLEKENYKEEKEMIDTKRNLCDGCKYDIPVCGATKIEFGDGVGNDNVIECDTFEPLPPTESNERSD